EATFGRIGQMVELAYEMRDLLLAGDLDAFGAALHRGWMMKRGVLTLISNASIDGLYERARAAGALGGKIAGAGGGGFLLLYCPKPAQAAVRDALPVLRSLVFQLDWGGARVAVAPASAPAGGWRSDRSPPPAASRPYRGGSARTRASLPSWAPPPSSIW